MVIIIKTDYIVFCLIDRFVNIVTSDILLVANRLLLSVAGQWLVRQPARPEKERSGGESNNLNGSASWKQQWINVAAVKQ